MCNFYGYSIQTHEHKFNKFTSQFFTFLRKRANCITFNLLLINNHNLIVELMMVFLLDTFKIQQRVFRIRNIKTEMVLELKIMDLSRPVYTEIFAQILKGVQAFKGSRLLQKNLLFFCKMLSLSAQVVLCFHFCFGSIKTP